MTSAMISEKWVPVQGFNGIYEVSDRGRLRSSWSIGGKSKQKVGDDWRILSGSQHRLGYFGVELRHPNGKRKRVYIHQLVASAFCQKTECDTEVRHLDGNPRNNSANNLQWGTHAENGKDIVRHKSCLIGEQTKNTSLTNDRAKSIVKLHSIGFTQKYLAKQFAVSPMTVSRIVRGVKWSLVTGVEHKANPPQPKE